jgi:two-component system CheB/CheR fusion protein
MGFVFIQHLDPNHKSLLTEALTKATKMPVSQAGDGTQVKPNHVYVIPPNADIAILHGVLTLLPRHDTRGLHLAIDSFFRSLASAMKSCRA